VGPVGRVQECPRLKKRSDQLNQCVSKRPIHIAHIDMSENTIGASNDVSKLAIEVFNAVIGQLNLGQNHLNIFLPAGFALFDTHICQGGLVSLKGFLRRDIHSLRHIASVCLHKLCYTPCASEKRELPVHSHYLTKAIHSPMQQPHHGIKLVELTFHGLVIENLWSPARTQRVYNARD